MALKYLAIDPSLRNTGVAIMDDTRIYSLGLIETKKGEGLVYLDNQRCIEYVAGDLVRLTVRYAEVGHVYCEAKSGSKSVRAATAMAMAQAIVIATMRAMGNVVTLMLPQEVKKRICGSRKASKDDIKAAVQALYPEAEKMMVAKGITQKGRQEHIYDAIAIGRAISQRKKEA